VRRGSDGVENKLVFLSVDARQLAQASINTDGSGAQRTPAYAAAAKG